MLPVVPALRHLANERLNMCFAARLIRRKLMVYGVFDLRGIEEFNTAPLMWTVHGVGSIFLDFVSQTVGLNFDLGAVVRSQLLLGKI